MRPEVANEGSGVKAIAILNVSTDPAEQHERGDREKGEKGFKVTDDFRFYAEHKLGWKWRCVLNANSS